MDLNISFKIDAPKSGARRLALFAVLPIALIAVTGAVAHATLSPDPATWVSPGKPVSASSLAADLTQLDDRLSKLVPPGTVIAYAGSVGGALAPPSGWVLCDGSALSRAGQYAGLFAAIGISAGGGDGITTFNLPDYRGTFLRGQDHGSGRDPDAASRSAMAVGGTTGDSVGSIELASTASHTHGVNDPGHHHADWGTFAGQNLPGGAFSYAGTPDGAKYGQTGDAQTGITLQASGGSETRPVNAAVNYLIKY